MAGDATRDRPDSEESGLFYSCAYDGPEAARIGRCHHQKSSSSEGEKACHHERDRDRHGQHERPATRHDTLA